MSDLKVSGFGKEANFLNGNTEHVDSHQAGAELERDIRNDGQKNRSMFEDKYGYLCSLRRDVVGILAEYYNCKSGVRGRSTPETSTQVSFIATFVQGVGISESLIMEGQYAKATAVLKQDTEMLARIIEIELGVAQEGVTPNVKHLPEDIRRISGLLNNLAHPSNTNDSRSSSS